MKRSRTTPSTAQERQLLAEACARLIANDGMTDYALVKRKAARQMGCDGTRNLPGNEEIDEALKAYRFIYHGDTHPEVLQALRQRALDLMQVLKSFEPWLTGPVLSGSAGEHSDIDLLILSDDPKAVEFFLLNAGIDYRHAQSPHPEGVSMRWLDEGTGVLLTVLPLRQARYKSQNERLRAEGVQQQLLLLQK